MICILCVRIVCDLLIDMICVSCHVYCVLYRIACCVSCVACCLLDMVNRVVCILCCVLCIVYCAFVYHALRYIYDGLCILDCVRSLCIV